MGSPKEIASMKVHWRHWCAASIAVHAAMMGALSSAARPARVRPASRAPASVVTVPVDFAPAAPPPLTATSATPAPPTVADALGGVAHRQNLDAEQRGERGDGRSLERGRQMAARAERINLDERLLDADHGVQEQRIATARRRASPQDDRRTPNPDEDPWVSTGDGVLLLRVPHAPALPAAGAAAPSVATAATRAGPAPAGATLPDAVFVGPGHGDRDLVERPRTGIAGAAGTRSRAAGPVAMQRPSVEPGHASTTSDRMAPRTSDDADAALLATAMLRDHLNASVQDGPRRAVGEGGVGGGGAPGSGGGVGRGGEARPLGDGDGWIALGTEDARYIRYLHEVRRRLQPLWRDAFPYDEALRLRQGTVVLQFVIARDGSVHAPQVSRHSGVERFDANVLAAVSRARLPPIPEALGRSELRIRAPFEFRNPVVR
jgi:TonB family protein